MWRSRRGLRRSRSPPRWSTLRRRSRRPRGLRVRPAWRARRAPYRRDRRGNLLGDGVPAHGLLGQMVEDRAGGDRTEVVRWLGLVDHDHDRDLGVARREVAHETRPVPAGLGGSVATAFTERLVGRSRLRRDREPVDLPLLAGALLDHPLERLVDLRRGCLRDHPTGLADVGHRVAALGVDDVGDQTRGYVHAAVGNHVVGRPHLHGGDGHGLADRDRADVRGVPVRLDHAFLLLGKTQGGQSSETETVQIVDEGVLAHHLGDLDGPDIRGLGEDVTRPTSGRCREDRGRRWCSRRG